MSKYLLSINVTRFFLFVFKINSYSCVLGKIISAGKILSIISNTSFSLNAFLILISPVEISA